MLLFQIGISLLLFCLYVGYPWELFGMVCNDTGSYYFPGENIKGNSTMAVNLRENFSKKVWLIVKKTFCFQEPASITECDI